MVRTSPSGSDGGGEASGRGIALDLHCHTPEEFREEPAGPGYLGQAKRRGELLRVGVWTTKSAK